MLHWNGQALEPQPFLPEGHPVWDMVPYEGRLYESMRLQTGDKVVKEVQRPPALRSIKADFTGEESPFESVPPENSLLYSQNEFSTALDYLHLSTSEGSIWAGAGPQVPDPERSRPAGVTILRKPPGGEWTSVVGPQEGEDEELPPPGQVLFPGDVLSSIAAEPGSSSAWIALDTEANLRSPNPWRRAAGGLPGRTRLLGGYGGWVAPASRHGRRAGNPDAAFGSGLRADRGRRTDHVPPAGCRGAAGTIRRTAGRQLG